MQANFHAGATLLPGDWRLSPGILVARVRQRNYDLVGNRLAIF